MAPAPDTGAAIGWLSAWSADGPWIIVEFDPEKPNPSPIAAEFNDLVAAERHIAERNGRVNLYFIPNIASLEKCEAYPSGGKHPPKKEHISRVVAVFIDLDLPKSKGSSAPPTKENFEHLLDRIRSLSPAPSVIIFSGGGYQAYWLFEESLPADEYLDRAEAVGQAIMRNLGSDAVQNVNRMMRLPGTINIPSPAKRSRGRETALSYVVEADWPRRWAFSTHAIPRVIEDDDNDTSIDDDLISALVNRVDRLPKEWRHKITKGDVKDYGDDRSRLVIATCIYLLSRGWTDDDVTTIISDKHFGVSAHCRDMHDPTNGAKRQVARAKAKLSSDWDRNHVGGIDAQSPRNLARAMRELGIKLSYNAFSNRSWVNGVDDPILLDDHIYNRIIHDICDTCRFVPNERMLHITIDTLACRESYHPVRTYLDSLKWDGVPRIDGWLVDLAGAEDCEYTRTVGRLTLLAAVRRVRQPGCKFDEMLVLISPEQGTSKSSALQELAVEPDWFSDSFSFKSTDKLTIEQLGGRWIVECAELAGMYQSDIESTKSMLSRTTDRARTAYGHYTADFPRQCIFIGTTNSTAFLRDRLNRRYWPIRVKTFDLDTLKAQRDQMWAEASYREAQNESIKLPESLWPVAARYQEDVRSGEPWVEILSKYLRNEHGRIASTDIWLLIGKPEHMRGAADNARLTEAMLELGWERSVQVFDDISTRCFIKGSLTQRRRVLFAYLDPTDAAIGFKNYTIMEAVSGSADDVRESLEKHKYDDVPF